MTTECSLSSYSTAHSWNSNDEFNASSSLAAMAWVVSGLGQYFSWCNIPGLKRIEQNMYDVKWQYKLTSSRAERGLLVQVPNCHQGWTGKAVCNKNANIKLIPSFWKQVKVKVTTDSDQISPQRPILQKWKFEEIYSSMTNVVLLGPVGGEQKTPFQPFSHGLLPFQLLR